MEARCWPQRAPLGFTLIHPTKGKPGFWTSLNGPINLYEVTFDGELCGEYQATGPRGDAGQSVAREACAFSHHFTTNSNQ